MLWHGNSKSFLLRHFSFALPTLLDAHNDDSDSDCCGDSAAIAAVVAALDNFVEWSRSRTVCENWDNMRVVVAVVVVVV